MKYARFLVAMAALVALLISSAMILPVLVATNDVPQLLVGATESPLATGMIQSATIWTNAVVSDIAVTAPRADVNVYDLAHWATATSPPRYDSPSASLVGTVDEYLYSIALAASFPAGLSQRVMN